MSKFKTVCYLGLTFKMPDQYNYIAADIDGTVTAYVHEPEEWEPGYWSPLGGNYRPEECLKLAPQVEVLRYPIHRCKFTERPA